ncbi:MAG: hypothetical protein HYU69_14105, partial [Bacteroidetes bacterium]|nr:hypothetical protein [Bacteroidota bacterium]
MNRQLQIIFAVTFILPVVVCYAQPANDNKASATDITALINGCSVDAAYTSVSATADESKGSCMGSGPNYNTWFKFTASATGFISIQFQSGGTAGTQRYTYVTLWDASLVQLGCSAYSSQYVTSPVKYLGLTVGATYYVSVDNLSGAYTGTFKLCLSDVIDFDCKVAAVDVT